MKFWIGRIVDIIDRSGSRPKRMTDYISLEELTDKMFLRCSWLVPAGMENEKKFEEATYKLEPCSLAKDNRDELKAQYIISCPVMTHDEVNDTFTVRGVDLEFIKEWAATTRAAVDSGELRNEKPLAKGESKKRKRRAVVESDSEDEMEVQPEKQAAPAVTTRSGRQVKAKTR